MQKKGSILLLLVVISILVAGCQLTGSRGKGSIPDSSSAFKGSDGLVLSFFDDAPPDKVIPSSKDFESKFKIAVLLENKGAADITCNNDPESCGFFLIFSKEPITGITPSTGKLKDALDVIDGKSKLIGKESYLSGGRAAMELNARVAEKVDKTTTSTITVDACYPYKTSLSASVCVQTAHYTVPEKSRACELKTLSFSNQGAPVAVTKIEQESVISGEYIKPRLKIFISEVGKGTVIDESIPSLKKACTSDTTNLNDIIGKVKVQEATVSGEKLNCQDKIITLTGIPKKDFVECIFESNAFKSGAANNLVAPLKIVLSYGYQTAISKDVKIEVLDAPPKIKRFSITPLKPEPGKEDLKIFVAAEDDIGLKEIQLLDKDGKHIPPSYPCNDKVSCSNTFTISKEETKLKQAGEVFIYKAMAVDTAGKPSDVSIASGTFGGIIVKIELPKEAPAGTEITITASATSIYTTLKTLELTDDKGTVLAKYDCKNKTCTTTFKRKAPEKGKTDTYQAKATDSQGDTAPSEKKSVTGTAPASP